MRMKKKDWKIELNGWRWILKIDRWDLKLCRRKLWEIRDLKRKDLGRKDKMYIEIKLVL